MMWPYSIFFRWLCTDLIWIRKCYILILKNYAMLSWITSLLASEFVRLLYTKHEKLVTKLKAQTCRLDFGRSFYKFIIGLCAFHIGWTTPRVERSVPLPRKWSQRLAATDHQGSAHYTAADPQMVSDSAHSSDNNALKTALSRSMTPTCIANNINKMCINNTRLKRLIVQLTRLKKLITRQI